MARSRRPRISGGAVAVFSAFFLATRRLHCRRVRESSFTIATAARGGEARPVVFLHAPLDERGFVALRPPVGSTCRSPTPRRRPSPCQWRVGSHVRIFEACSAFTRVTACLLAE